jgi:hypothetical protein
VIFAIHGTALDVSELEGLPGGSVLLLDGNTFQITGTRVTTSPAAIRVTMFQRQTHADGDLGVGVSAVSHDAVADRGVKPYAAAEPPTGHDGGDPLAHHHEPTVARPQPQTNSSSALGGDIGSGIDADPRTSAMRGLSSTSASLELSPDPALVRRARRWTAHQLESWGLTAMADSATLVVCELVTNAITASAASPATTCGPAPRDVALHLHYNGETLLIEVFDHCFTALPEVRHSVPVDEGGRGLQVVAALSKQWGLRETAQGKVVWCELSGEQ